MNIRTLCAIKCHIDPEFMTTRCELDSHADTCVAGANCLVVVDDGRTANVYPYNEDYKPEKSIPIGTVATLWDCPKTGQTYVLIIHEALYFGDKLPDTLLTPNQLQAHGLKVDKVPKQYDSKSNHSISSFPKPDRDVHIPLELSGVISGFETRKPT
jgi:hypothetical protein